MSAYAIFIVDEEYDKEKMTEYRNGARATFNGREMKILTLPSCEKEVVEGGGEVDAIIIVEFPTIEEARDWNHSEEYQKWAKVRQGITKGRAFIVDGFDMP